MANRVYTAKADFERDNEKLACPLPYTDKTDILASPLMLGSKTAKNRLCCQAMEGCDGTPDGRPDSLTVRRYDRLAKGGAGIIWFEATAVLPEARANPRQLYINEQTVDAFAFEVERIREAAIKETGVSPLIFMQATHSGRYSKPHGTPAPLIACHNPLYEEKKPIGDDRILTDDEIEKVGDALVNGARLAEKAGFDGVDIKCCHRYLNSELLSAYTRKGKYGGDFMNRTRLLRESVAGAVAATKHDFLVSTRMNAYDGIPYPYGFGVTPEGGIEFCPDEPVKLLQMLYKSGMKIANITMGNPYENPHVNRPFASGGYIPDEHPLFGVSRMLNGIAVLKSRVPDMKIIASAFSYLGVVSPNVAAAFIGNGGFDFAGFGRMIFAYPDFAESILKTGGLDKNKICIACSKCTEIMRNGGTPGCIVRDAETYMPIYRQFCNKR